MPMPTPDWLSKRGGELRLGPGGDAGAVLLDGQPQYVLLSSPAGGKFHCVVKQSNNGQRLDGNMTYPTLEDAIRGGLEDLRAALGW